MVGTVTGHDFSRAARPEIGTRALAPEGSKDGFLMSTSRIGKENVGKLAERDVLNQVFVVDESAAMTHSLRG